MAFPLIVCGLLLSSAETQSQFPDLPLQVRKSIDELIALIDARATATEDSVATLRKRHEKFLRLLSKLERQVDKRLLKKVKASTELRFEKNLILMSKDYVQNPDRTKEIMNYAGLSLRASQPQWKLVPKLSTADYRSFHELFLIMPKPTIGFGYNPLRFLGTLHDNESLPVIVREFRLTTSKEVHHVFDYQQRILRTLLASYRNPYGLKAILKCLSVYEKATKGKPVAPKGKSEHRALVQRVLTGSQKWRKILKSFPVKEVSEKDRKMLTEALKKLEADAKKTANRNKRKKS